MQSFLQLQVWEQLNEEKLRKDLEAVLAQGITSLAVVLLHSYTFSEHERVVGNIARQVGFRHVSLSSNVMPMVKAVPRGFTASADAYLTPCIQRYIKGFASGFKDADKLRVLFMQSDGGLTPMDQFIGARAILSGPAGGVVGYSTTCYRHDGGVARPVIGFDMGGTSTDVSRYAGEFEHVFETTTAGVTIQSPQLDINTVAAGGGSMLFFRSGLFAVGPDSAGANPGPVWGPLTVTDANLCLGRLIPEYFPKIFGPDDNEPLNKQKATEAFQVLTNEGKGYDTARHTLACFGGAGGQHCCAIARALGMTTVLVHRYSGILSAYGLALADVVYEAQEPCAVVYEASSFQYLDEKIKALSEKCVLSLQDQGFERSDITTTPYLHLRYSKTDCALMCTSVSHSSGATPTPHHGDFKHTFIERYQGEFGFTIPDRPIVVDDIRCYFSNGFLETNVYVLDHMTSGHSVQGPCIIIDKNCTIVVEPDCEASITSYGDVKIQERLDFSCAMFGPDGGLVANAPHIPVHLGAMQEAVQFQLGYLGDNLHEGDVILSNHPLAGGSHLPDLTVITPVFYPGAERPVFFVASRGHHADIGGLTPGKGRCLPTRSISGRKGCCVKSFKLVEQGIFQEAGVTELLMAPAMYPGCSGTRNLHDNLSDLRAQVAANHKGIALVKALIDEYGLTQYKLTEAYPGQFAKENAAVAVRDMLKEIAAKAKDTTGHASLEALDYMDDGTPIKLRVEITEEGDACFDFTGTGARVHGNCNAPRAVVLSAIIYCLRCMVAHDIPLNQGCLSPVRVVIPTESLLHPSEDSAVVGGNVLTSQRLVDVVFRAFGTCAASQGCMNNTTFGDATIGYYETVAGGAGAGPGWHGRSGVHTHMTNTRITDPEILERRYPAILKSFQLREGTGGRGLYNGGDGVVREIVFRRPMTLSLMSERRVYAPYGLNGGCDGAKGKNVLITAAGEERSLGSKATVQVLPGDTFHLETPGGGGYGNPSDMLGSSAQGMDKYDQTTARSQQWKRSQHQGQRRKSESCWGTHRIFIPDYATVAAPLTELTKKATPNKTDASDWGVGGVLSQVDERGQDHPVAYFSRKLLARERRVLNH
eukprot:Em0003g269a